MYSVSLVVSSGSYGIGKVLPRGLEYGRGKTFRFLPTDELCEWLREFSPSLKTIEQFSRNPSSWGQRDVIGLVFCFDLLSEAVLFKLAWGGL